MSELLNVKVMDLKGRVRNRRLRIWLCSFEKERMMIRKLEAAIDMEENGRGLAANADYIRNCQRKVFRIPVEHDIVISWGISDTVVTPTVDRNGFSGGEPLEFA